MKNKITLIITALISLFILTSCQQGMFPDAPRGNIGGQAFQAPQGFANPDGSFHMAPQIIHLGYLSDGEQVSTAKINIGVQSDLVYSKGYYSVNGGEWAQFNLQGSNIGGGWLHREGTAKLTFNTETLPESSEENYVLVYSCNLNNNNQWDCHDNQWMIRQFSAQVNTQPPETCPEEDTCAYDGDCWENEEYNEETNSVCDKGNWVKLPGEPPEVEQPSENSGSSDPVEGELSQPIKVGEEFTLQTSTGNEKFRFVKVGTEQNVITLNQEETGIKEFTYPSSGETELIYGGKAFKTVLDQNDYTIRVENAHKSTVQPPNIITFLNKDEEIWQSKGEIWQFEGLDVDQKLGDFVEGEVPSNVFPAGRISTDQGLTEYKQYLRFKDEKTGKAFPPRIIRGENDAPNEEYGMFLYAPEGEKLPADAIFEWEVDFVGGLKGTVKSLQNNKMIIDSWEDKVLNILGKDFVIVNAEVGGNNQSPRLSLAMVEGDVTDVLQEGETKTYSRGDWYYDQEVSLLMVGKTSGGSLEAKFLINGEITDSLGKGDVDILKNGLKIGVRDTSKPVEGKVNLSIDGEIDATLTEGSTYVHTVDGEDYEISLVFVSNSSGPNSSIKLLINGQTNLLTEGQELVMPGKFEISINSIESEAVSSKPGIAEFFLAETLLYMKDDNTADGNDNSNMGFENGLEESLENIEEGWVKLEGGIIEDKGEQGVIDDGDVFQLNKMKYRIVPDPITGIINLYIPPGSSVREFLDEPEGLLNPDFDIRYDVPFVENNDDGVESVKTCPNTMCEAPPQGCHYEESDEMNANGCPRYPCGKLVCDDDDTGLEPGACKDSDGGENKYVRGTVKGPLTSSDKIVEFADRCYTTENGEVLLEEGICGIFEEKQCNDNNMYCGEGGDCRQCDDDGTVKVVKERGVAEGTNVITGPHFLECEYGCEDGVCIR